MIIVMTIALMALMAAFGICDLIWGGFRKVGPGMVFFFAVAFWLLGYLTQLGG